MPGVPHPAKAEIVARGLTQKQVAQEVGINANLFTQVLNRRRSSWPALRARLADYLDLPEDDLFTEVP